MKRYHKSNSDRLLVSPRQQGGLTIFTAVFVLILMTLLLVYATRVGVFEQRTSANDMRQKMAFHAAEAGLDYGFEFLTANALAILSTSAEATSDGDGNYRPGWFLEDNPRWLACPGTPGLDHPCGVSPDSNANSFYYDADGVPNNDGAYDSLPLDTGLLTTLLPDGVTEIPTEFRVTAVLCRRTLDNDQCLGRPLPGEEVADDPAWTAFLLAYGYSDCNDDDASGEIDLPGECRGRAHVTRAVGSIDAFSGKPTVPLVSRNTLPTSGNSEVVPNPNGGGQGVPTSIWSNSASGDVDCPSGVTAGPRNPDGTLGETIEVGSSFTTCEMHEWYEVDSKPDDASCPHSSRQKCGCDYPGPEPLSYNHGKDAHIDIDIIQDAAFPCDLFEFYWGVEGFPTKQYVGIKELATVIYDCQDLGPGDTGFFWFEGDECTLDSVGTSDHPVLLVSAADSRTNLNGNADFYGILYLANVEDPEQDACFKPGGGATVYGAVIVDVLFCGSKLGGTFSIVYNGGILNNAAAFGGVGGLPGTWRDFGLPEFPWKPLP